jgi:hypothetical protein
VSSKAWQRLWIGFVLVAVLASWAFAMEQTRRTSRLQTRLEIIDRNICAQVNEAHRRLNVTIARQQLLIAFLVDSKIGGLAAAERRRFLVYALAQARRSAKPLTPVKCP